MIECGDEEDGDDDGASEGSGKYLKEVDLGIHGQFLLKKLLQSPTGSVGASLPPMDDANSIIFSKKG